MLRYAFMASSRLRAMRVYVFVIKRSWLEAKWDVKLSARSKRLGPDLTRTLLACYTSYVLSTDVCGMLRTMQDLQPSLCIYQVYKKLNTSSH